MSSIRRRVAADQQRADMVAQVRGDRELAAVEGGVADAGQAVLGLDDQGDVVAARARRRPPGHR